MTALCLNTSVADLRTTVPAASWPARLHSWTHNRSGTGPETVSPTAIDTLAAYFNPTFYPELEPLRDASSSGALATSPGPDSTSTLLLAWYRWLDAAFSRLSTLHGS
jgi:hypothetical protein